MGYKDRLAELTKLQQKTLLEFKQSTLDEYLNLCTREENKFFKRIFPNDVPLSKLDDAILLCERTLAKRAKKDIT